MVNKRFEISLNKIVGGTAYVNAKTVEEARTKALAGEWYGYIQDPNFNDYDAEDGLVFADIIFGENENENNIGGK